MDYLKIHDAIIAKAIKESRSKENSVYYESHHIIPKCMGGSDNKDNLVLLTAKEHYLIHWLLAEIHNTPPLWWAFIIMVNAKGKGQKRQYVSGRLYELAKHKARELRKAQKVSDTTRQKMSLSRTGKKATDQHRQNISNSLRGRTVSIEERLRLSKLNMGRTLKAEHKLKVKLNSSTARKVLQFDKNNVFLQEWPSVSAASEATGITTNAIRKSCNTLSYKRNLKSRIYYWKYK